MSQQPTKLKLAHPSRTSFYSEFYLVKVDPVSKKVTHLLLVFWFAYAEEWSARVIISRPNGKPLQVSANDVRRASSWQSAIQVVKDKDPELQLLAPYNSNEIARDILDFLPTQTLQSIKPSILVSLKSIQQVLEMFPDLEVELVEESFVRSKLV